MRPLSLQISGLNSFRKSVAVDFDVLLKDGLFGIFGPTGSGKSTILDAITLALYGKVRRAPGGTQGIINMGEPRCSVSFSFSIGENGGRRHCTVERLLARNKTGGVDTKKVRLAVYRDGVLEKVGEKINELKEMVNDIVGINADDFLRAVVLPQGAFADFLTLETRERGAVLQRLFGLFQLGDQLNHVLKQRAQELDQAYAAIQARMQDLRAYDDDALRLCHDAVGDARNHQLEARAILNDIEKRHADAAVLYTQIAEYRSLMENEESWQIQAVRLETLRARIELAERSISVAPAMAAVRAARIRFADADQRYNDAVREKKSSEETLSAMRTALTRAEEHYPSTYDRLGEEVMKLQMVNEGQIDLLARRERYRTMSSELAAIAEEFGTQAKLRDDAHTVLARMEEEIAATERRIQECTVPAGERQALNELQLSIQQQKNINLEIEQTRRETATLGTEIEGALHALDAATTGERIREQEVTAVREEVADLKSRHAAGQIDLENLLTQHSQLTGWLQKIESHEKSIITYESELSQQQTRIAGLREMLAYEQLRLKELQSLETAMFQERNSVAALREQTHRGLALASLAEQLQDGVPCPLCGAMEHLAPFHNGNSVTGELEAIGLELERAERKYREAEEQRRQVEQSFTRSESAIEHLENSIQEKAEKLAVERGALVVVLKEIETEPVIASADELRSRINVITNSGSEARKLVRELTASISACEGRAAIAESARGKAVEQRVRQEMELGARRDRHGKLDGTVDTLRTRLAEENESFTNRSNGRTLDDAIAAVHAMHEHDHLAEELRSDIRERRERLDLRRGKFEEMERIVREIGQRRDSLEGACRDLNADISAIAERLSRRLEEIVPKAEHGEAVERLIERRLARRDRIKREHDEVRARYDAASSEAHVARERVDTNWNLRCREEKDRDEAGRLCDTALAGHGFQTVAQAEDGMLPADQLRAHRDEAQSLEEELQRVRRRVFELREQIAGRTIEDTEMAALESALVAAKAADEDAIRHLGAAQEKLRECTEKNIEWKNVSQQDIFSTEGKATAEQLGRYLRGNGFIDFLANERLAGICRRATMQLNTLSSGRFAIDSRPNDGFIIRDNGNGGGERSPSSLSGGETFLVSLSLAVALSDTIQLGHAPLEFFFLDEGFGTLDSDLLETVMNTLEGLRSRHRAIGVISHVAQLRERISRRLIVTPASEVDGSSVRYEMA